MVDSTRQNPDMRDQQKCSECRRKKIKCRPRNRQWEPTHQKCDNCKKHDDAPCGPNYKKRDDPEEIAHSKERTGEGENQPRAPIRSEPFEVDNGNHPSRVTEESNGQRKRKFGSDKQSDELHEEVAHLLKKLHSFGRAYVHMSELTPVYCCNQSNPVKYNKGPEDKMKAVKDGFHSLFMQICQLGLQSHERGMDNDADATLKELMVALERYPGLGYERKYNALWNIAEFHGVKGDQDEHEWALTKAIEAHDPSLHPNDPCPLLAASFSETSRRAADNLLELWKEVFLVAGETSLAIPPIQRSAQHRNPGVVSILLDRPNRIAHSPPALFNLEGLHIAASRGYEQTLKIHLLAGAQVDAPDIHNHTALFLAAAKGHEECCAELIKCHANVNCRDSHGTTILEVAARAGHIKVVQQLVEANAEINPDLVCCTSSPLQAAIANQRPHLDVALYLMGKGGNVSVRRADGKNAIDLADEKCPWLAGILRQKERWGPQDFLGPPQTFSFDQTQLDFSPGVS